ncbi:T9SS type A sorting domain-containing protein [Flavobacterium amniphilum]|uniref:T9SS type A sorting domain-containing protein n=1 Tax=Flavobacterium amniphilum TaxID=1834035 RepID=UPI00202A0570|nr:T9SS type A sorting domain-containing protein [Flavobacterium amniphilum]MCL9804769.1 T9SS type A sorting domain-containing protein [Flavobacterium amniphilum]
MKQKSLWLYFLVVACHVQAQTKKKVDFSGFDRSGMQTSILLTDTKPFTVLGQNGKTYNMYNLYESYQELSKSDTQKRFLNTGLLASEIKFENSGNILKIGFIHTEFEIPSKEAYQRGLVSIENNKARRNSPSYIFNKHTNTIVSPLAVRKKGVNTTFLFDSKYFINTTADKIKTIRTDFGDGKGYINTELDNPVSVSYPTEGQKELHFEITFENGKKIIRNSALTVTYSNADISRLFRRTPVLITATRTPDLALYGENDLSAGKCEYEIFTSPDGIFDKPIYVVDGFDPSDSRNTTAVYNLLTYTDTNGNTQNLGDRIRNQEGYDIVVVNFPTYVNAATKTIDGGADYIERNALSLVTVIETLNLQKTGNEQNIVIGPSMGGLISRYALRFMEQNNLNHQTRLWISFDSPHYGANVPIGLQHLFNYFAYGYGDADGVKPLIDGMLRSPAAKQMLVDHFQAHTAAGPGAPLGDDPIIPSAGLPLTPAGYPNIRDNFQNRMNSMGFPQTTRNISMINGSGNLAKFKDKLGNDINPGFDFIGTAATPANIDTGDVFAFINTRALTFCEYMPNANVQEIITDVDIQAQVFFWVTQDSFTATAKQSANTNGVDSSPGGLFDMSGLAASLPPGDDVLTNFMNAMKADKFSFIPAVSAMGLNIGGNINNSQPNYYFNINLGAKDIPWDGINTTTSNTTPFKNWHMPPTNENHVTITQGNVDFAWCEIVKPDFNFALNTSNTVTACQGNTASYTFNFNGIHGCLPNPISFTATGAPAGSSITFSPNSIAANGIVTMNVSNVLPGTYTINVTPVNFPTKTIPVTLTVNPSNPNLSGTTQYSLNGDNLFTTATSVTVQQGTNLELRIPSNLYTGTIEWFDPTGASRGNTNPVINNIQDSSTEEGTWNAKITFDNDCSRMAPTNIPMTVIVDTSLGNNSPETFKLKLYPNPSKDILNITGTNIPVDMKVQIVDICGRIIQNTEARHINANHLQINVSSLSGGTYLVVMENQNQRYAKSFVKQ